MSDDTDNKQEDKVVSFTKRFEDRFVTKPRWVINYISDKDTVAAKEVEGYFTNFMPMLMFSSKEETKGFGELVWSIPYERFISLERAN
jgi:hypothetical protein